MIKKRQKDEEEERKRIIEEEMHGSQFSQDPLENGDKKEGVLQSISGGFKTFGEYMSSILVSITKRCYSMSIEYRYVMRKLSKEKDELKVK